MLLESHEACSWVNECLSRLFELSCEIVSEFFFFLDFCVLLAMVVVYILLYNSTEIWGKTALHDISYSTWHNCIVDVCVFIVWCQKSQKKPVEIKLLIKFCYNIQVVSTKH